MYPHCGCSTKNTACSTLFSSSFTNRTTLFLFVIIDFLSWQRFFFYFTHCFGFSFLFIFNLIFVSFGFLFLALLQFSFLRQISTDLSIEKVWHQGLHYKLRQNGVSGKLLNTLTDFLDNRTQRVILKDQFSSWAMVVAGVSQDLFMYYCPKAIFFTRKFLA